MGGPFEGQRLYFRPHESTSISRAARRSSPAACRASAPPSSKRLKASGAKVDRSGISTARRKVDVGDPASVEAALKSTLESSARSTCSSTTPASPARTCRRSTTRRGVERVLDVNLTARSSAAARSCRTWSKAELRPHRQHRLGRRQGRQSQRPAYSAVEGRRDRAHQVARQGARADRRARQLRDAGGGEDGDLRPDDAAAHRLHAVEDSDGPLRRRSTRSPRWSAGSPPRIARSRPARCSTSRAAARPTDDPEETARAAQPGSAARTATASSTAAGSRTRACRTTSSTAGR